MAIAFTNLTSGSTTAADPGTTASISPTANQPVYVFVAAAGDGNQVSWSPSVSGCNLTWTQIVTNFQYGARRLAMMFRGVGASPSAGTLSITIGMNTGWQETMWIVDQATGVDDTTPEGTTATNSGSGATSATVTVSGTPDAGDFVYAAFVHTGASSDMTINGELSNELAEVGSGANVRRVLTAYDSSPDSTPVPGVTWTGAEDWAGIAFIVNVGGATQSNAPRAAAYYRMMRSR